MKNIKNIYLKFFIFLVVKFSVYLNRHVFVMASFLQREKLAPLFLGRKSVLLEYTLVGSKFFPFKAEPFIELPGTQKSKWKVTKVVSIVNQGVNLIKFTQGPVFQSIVSLTSSLVVKMLTVLVSMISNLQVFMLKNVSSFCI